MTRRPRAFACVAFVRRRVRCGDSTYDSTMSMARISARSRARSAFVTARTIRFPSFAAMSILFRESLPPSSCNAFDRIERATRPRKFVGENREPCGDGEPPWAWHREHDDSGRQESEPDDDLHRAHGVWYSQFAPSMLPGNRQSFERCATTVGLSATPLTNSVAAQAGESASGLVTKSNDAPVRAFMRKHAGGGATSRSCR
jgi:hypothetical protein